MSNFLKANGLGSTNYNHFKMINETIEKNWDELGFLEGLTGQKKHNMGLMFENQAKFILESSTSVNSGSFETVVFPMIRRIFSKLLANDIVSVQAMNLPIGKLFFFVPKISARDEDGNHTSTMADQLPTIIVDGEKSTKPLTQWQSKNLYDMYYNDGLIDHSKGAKQIVQLGAIPVTTWELDENGDYKAIEGAGTFKTASDGTVREVIVAITDFQEYQGKLAWKGEKGMFRADGVQQDTDSFLSSLKYVTTNPISDRDGNVIIPAGSEIPFTVMTQKYGKAIVANESMSEKGAMCNKNGTFYARLDLTHPVALNEEETYDGYVGADIADGTAFKALGITANFVEYGSLEMATDMGEVTFNLEEITISTETRKLRSTWSPELAQDVNAFHAIDAEAELTAMLSEQISAEIDREILKDLRTAAAWTARWNRLGWKSSSLASNAYTQKDWNQELLSEINRISAQIQKSTLRGGASFIVVSTEVSAVLNDLEYFHVSDASAESEQYNMGISKAGVLQGRYIVYVDPYSPANSIIVGHKGQNILDAGYIYAPYVPIQLTPVMYNHNNFAPVRGISTRYAKKVVNNRFFGHIRVDGLRTWSDNELR